MSEQLTRRWVTVTHFKKDRTTNKPYLLGDHRGRTYRLDVTPEEMKILHRTITTFDGSMQLTNEWNEI